MSEPEDKPKRALPRKRTRAKVEGAQPMPWFGGQQKGLMLEGWFLSVVGDDELDRAEIKTAWALSFLFNSKDGKAWVGDRTLAYSIGVQPETVRQAVRGLMHRGHVVRTREGKKRVLRPALRPSRGILKVGQRPPPDFAGVDDDGEPSTTEPVDVTPSVPVDVTPHILREYPLKDHGRVEDVAPAVDQPHPAEPSETDQGLSRQEHPEPCSICGQPSVGHGDYGDAYCEEHMWAARDSDPP